MSGSSIESRNGNPYVERRWSQFVAGTLEVLAQFDRNVAYQMRQLLWAPRHAIEAFQQEVLREVRAELADLKNEVRAAPAAPPVLDPLEIWEREVQVAEQAELERWERVVRPRT